jgi:hypothetical protein
MVANATKPERLLQVWRAADAQWWPPKTTIEDDTLSVLDDRFGNVLRTQVSESLGRAGTKGDRGKP